MKWFSAKQAPRSGTYLVTSRTSRGELLVDTRKYFDGVGWNHGRGDVIAWAQPPKPSCDNACQWFDAQAGCMALNCTFS